jgi:hypothetical protein
MRRCWIYLFVVILTLLSCPLVFGSEKISGDGNSEENSPALNERRYLEDAFRDAKDYFPGVIDKPVLQCQFTIDRGFTSDLIHNGHTEFIVSGNIDSRINYVLLYYLENEQWHCSVLNRCLGGSVFDVKIIDVDNDGSSEIYSVLMDQDLRKYCRINKYFRDESDHVSTLFSLDTKGGLQSSYIISLMRSSDKECYKVRVDEMEYPADDGGDVHQRTYFYALVQHMFVLEHSWSGKQ